MGRGFALALVLVFLMSLSILPPVAVKAQSKTIVVPDDYRTISAAIDNATNGDTILVRSGTYNEQSLKTNNSISLIGEGATSTIIKLHPPIVTWSILDQTFSGYAAPIDFSADNIVISGFTITSDGGNIALTGNHDWLAGNIINTNVELGGDYETVTNNTLNLNNVLGVQIGGSYCSISRNTGTGEIGTGPGSYNSVFANDLIGEIGDFGAGRSNLFYGNILEGGIGMSAQTSDIIVNNTITNCDHGVSISNGFNNFVYGNTIKNNQGAGLIKIEGLNNLFYANYVSNNEFGVQIGAQGSYTVDGTTVPVGNTTFYANDFIGNSHQVQVSVSSTTDHWNYGNQGNYWSDYNGTDENIDGIGDTPYFVGGTESDDYPLMTTLNISSINIQLPAWANLTLPNLLPTPSFPPSPIQSPSASPSPSPIVSSLQSPSPLLSPSQTHMSTQEPFPTLPELVAISVILAVVVVAAGLLVNHKKRKRGLVAV